MTAHPHDSRCAKQPNLRQGRDHPVPKRSGVMISRQSTRVVACFDMVETGIARPASQDADVKFKAAQEKTEIGRVHTLTQKDIEGLSSEQLKQLRGY